MIDLHGVAWQTRGRIHSDLFSYDARGRVLAVSALTDSMVNVYQGLGAIYSAQHQALYPGAGSWDTQTYVIDPLGNQRTVTYQQPGLQDPTASYAAHSGRLFKRSFPSVTPNDDARLRGEVTMDIYDSMGRGVRVRVKDRSFVGFLEGARASR